MKSIILNIINSNTGIKEVQLAMRVMEYIEPSTFSDVEFHNVLEGMIEKGEISVIKYRLPYNSTSGNKIKSVYFPKGTQFQLESNK